MFVQYCILTSSKFPKFTGLHLCYITKDKTLKITTRSLNFGFAFMSANISLRIDCGFNKLEIDAFASCSTPEYYLKLKLAIIIIANLIINLAFLF